MKKNMIKRKEFMALGAGALAKDVVPDARTKAGRVGSWRLGTSVGRLGECSQQKLDLLSKLGFQCIEVCVPASDVQMDQDFERLGRQARRLKECADKASIEIWSVHLPFGEAYDPSLLDVAERKKVVEKLDRILKAVEPLEVSFAVLHPSYEPINPAERQARLAACRESLPSIVDNAAKRGVLVAIECLPRTCLGNTSDEVIQLAEGINGLGVCFDTNHLLQETPQDFVRQVGGRIATLHVSDYDGVDERHWLPGAPGSIINWNEVVDALAETGYGGPFMFETSIHGDGTFSELVQVFNKMKGEWK